MSPAARILFVEDDARLRRLVPALVDRPDFAWTCAGSVAEALAIAERIEPALVLTDLGLPDGDGVALIGALSARAPGLPIVVLTVASSEARVLAAIWAGACDYVLKEDLGTRLAAALADALAGGVPMSPAAARAVLAEARRAPVTRAVPTPEAPLTQGLTARERQVVEQLGRGLTYEQVAMVLGVSINTVRSHVRVVYEKLGVASKTQAVLLALQRGLIAAE
jgi:DNA-binding NarL/FixJ family response regulator